MPEKQTKARIVICEDEVLIAADLERRLKDLGYVICGKASTGNSAIELVDQHQPDLVMMDIVLHGEMDGIGAAEVIRDKWGIPVVFITAYADTEHLKRAKLTYPFGYVLKPIQDREMKITLEIALYVVKVDAERRKAEGESREREELLNATGAMAKVGGWELDAETLEVRWTEQAHRIHEVPLDYKPPLEEAINFFHPDDRKKLSDAINLALERGEPYDMELRFITAKGNQLWTRTKCIPELVDGKVVKLKGTFQDITEIKQAYEALYRSEKQYRILADNVSDVIFTLDMDLNYTYVSPSVYKMRGFLTEELLSGDISRSLTKSSMIEAARVLAEELELEKQHNADPERVRILELEMKCKDGTTIWTETKVSFLRDNHWNPIGIIGASRDISDHQKAEQALEQALHTAERQTKELELLLDGAKAVLEGSDFSSTARRIFDAACEMTGAVSGYVALLSDDAEENEVLFLESGGLPCSVDESLPMPIRGLRSEAYKTGQAVFDNDFMNSPWVEYMPDGHVELRNVMFAPLNIESKTLGIMGLANKPENFNEDDLRIASSFGQLAAIALRNSQADKKLIYVEKRNQALLDYSPVCHKIVDLDFNLQYISANGFKMLNLDPNADVYGKPYPFSFFPASFRIQMAENMKQVKETGNPIVMEALTNDIDGNEVWLESTIIPVFDDNEKIDYLTVVSADTTQRKKDEEDKIKLHADLQQAQKMEAIGTLTGGVAHDFNNLLQAINGYTQLLLMDKAEDDPDYSSLTAIQNSGMRAAELVRSLLLFSRKAEAELKPMELNIEVERARKILERTLPKMVNIDVHLGRRLWTVNADPVQMEQILLNLGTNAADAMPDGGTLLIETKNMVLDAEYARTHLKAKPGSYVMLSVSDTGHGMDRETQEKLFEPFFTTKAFGKGTGLGLASVYGIANSHDGFITCYSEVGQGTTFKIFFPAMEPSVDEQEKDIASEIPKGGDETILLVDDEAAIRGFAEQALIKFGYKVFNASSGEEALDLYQDKSTEIDLVITDIGMPGMGGHKFLQELFQINPTAKAVIASGYSMEGGVKKSMEAGALGYVGKPYQLSELLGSVRKALDTEQGN